MKRNFFMTSEGKTRTAPREGLGKRSAEKPGKGSEKRNSESILQSRKNRIGEFTGKNAAKVTLRKGGEGGEGTLLWNRGGIHAPTPKNSDSLKEATKKNKKKRLLGSGLPVGDR